jgi:hypothetical protein
VILAHYLNDYRYIEGYIKGYIQMIILNAKKKSVAIFSSVTVFSSTGIPGSGIWDPAVFRDEKSSGHKETSLRDGKTFGLYMFGWGTLLLMSLYFLY